MPQKTAPLRWLKYKYVTFNRIKDSPKNIAIGAGLGISFVVLPGIGIIGAYFVARLIKANTIAALIVAGLSKLAIPFFIYLNIQTGQIFIRENIVVDPEIVTAPIFRVDWSHMGYSFLLGSAINALIAFIVTYFIVYRFVQWTQLRLPRRVRVVKS